MSSAEFRCSLSARTLPLPYFHGGFGLLTIHGVPKPTYRAYEILHRIGTELFPGDCLHDTVDGWAVSKSHSLTVLFTNHALPRHQIETQRVRIFLSDAPEPVAVSIERIDDEHANPGHLWKEMGEPEYLFQAQIDRLKAASRLTRVRHPHRYEAGNLLMTVDLPPHGVAAITIDFAMNPTTSRVRP